jgi:hypothetical protein
MPGTKTVTMTEEEQREVWKRIEAECTGQTQKIGERSAALLAQTPEITLTVEGSQLMRALPDYMVFTVTARRNATGDGYHLARYEYEADLHDVYEEINERLFKEHLAYYVMQNAEDIFLMGHGLDWRE